MRIICCLLLWATATTCLSNNEPEGRHGLYSGRIENYTVTVPILVDEKGEALIGEELGRRGKRSAELNNYNNNNVHYKLEIGGEEVVVELFLNSEFISPNLVIERRTKEQRTRRKIGDLSDKTQERTKSGYKRVKRNADKPKTIQTNCHYKGRVKGQANSRVALSACNDGLAGVIVSEKHGEYWLEPVKEGESTKGGRQHIVFKRTTAVPETKKKKRKKKKKHERNCGTREPRRLRETRLEWQQQPGKMKVQGRGRSRKSRWRRSVSKERHVEALIVADTSMMKFHQDTYVETYLLTIMNMVSALYQDPSIGNQVNIVVVNIVLLESDAALDGLNVTVNADKTLESFCKWQEQQNYEDENHPNHHDVAILITREDICARQNTPCGTLGVAHVGGMCERERSCNVNEDNGITLAHTITHELGHNFGMYHDTEKIGCSRRDGSTQHVMTPSFEADTVEIAWSPCSRRDITNFLDKGLGSCLDDKPTTDEKFKYPELPAGAMYDSTIQCQLQFGNKGTEVCTPLPEICSRLWCVVDGVCTTMLKPAAPGTECGKRMWCVNQQCVPISEKPPKVDGGWSDWSGWSQCSRTCGAGVAIQERYCNHPIPAFGGKFCIGERRRYKICNTEPCPENTPSFRAVQCSSFDNELFNGNKYKWIPYFDKADPCELYCADEEDTIIVPWGDSALDGTPCRVGTRDMCIQGICKHVGCDWVIDSDAREDKCGICLGNGEQCDTISGVYNKTTGSGYTEVVTIPLGARNIYIDEMGSSKNYLGIGSTGTEKFYLNGKLEITLAGEYEVAGATGLYERDKDIERIHIPGPIKEDIVVYIIYRGKYKNLGISYNYTIPKQVPSTDREYEWHFSEWSACSVTCGSGHQTSVPVCMERKLGVVDESKCGVDIKPDKKMRVCNTHHCPTRWWTGPWQLCPSSCGDSSKVYRKRTVLCIEQTEQEPIVYAQPVGVRTYGGIEYVENSKKDSKKNKEFLEQEMMALPDSKCKGQDKPIEQELCPNLPPCDEKPSPTTPGVDGNGFNDYEFDDLEFLNLLNISYYDWIINLDKKDKKIRHDAKKGNETMKIFDSQPVAKENKKHMNNKKHKKIKRKKKEKYKKIAKIGEIEELQNDSKYDEVFLHKSNNNDYQLLTTAKSNNNNALSYVYYNAEDKKVKSRNQDKIDNGIS